MYKGTVGSPSPYRNRSESIRLPEWILSADQSDKDNDDRDHEQKVYEPTERVRRNEPEKPQNQEQGRNGIEHTMCRYEYW